MIGYHKNRTMESTEILVSANVWGGKKISRRPSERVIDDKPKNGNKPMLRPAGEDVLGGRRRTIGDEFLKLLDGGNIGKASFIEVQLVAFFKNSS